MRTRRRRPCRFRTVPVPAPPSVLAAPSWGSPPAGPLMGYPPQRLLRLVPLPRAPHRPRGSGRDERLAPRVLPRLEAAGVALELDEQHALAYQNQIRKAGSVAGHGGLPLTAAVHAGPEVRDHPPLQARETDDLALEGGLGDLGPIGLLAGAGLGCAGGHAALRCSALLACVN